MVSCQSTKSAFFSKRNWHSWAEISVVSNQLKMTSKDTNTVEEWSVPTYQRSWRDILVCPIIIRENFAEKAIVLYSLTGTNNLNRARMSKTLLNP